MKLDTTRTGRSLFEEELADQDGPALIKGPALDAAQIARLSATLPPAFVDMLRAQGFATLADRRYQFVDPADFAPLMTEIFKGDPQIDPRDVHVTGVSAFGEFKIWSGAHFEMTLSLERMSLSCSELARVEFTGSAHLMAALAEKADNPLARDPGNLARNLLPEQAGDIEMWDVANQPLFTRAVEALGPLEAGEVFAFDPPLATYPGVRPRHPLERMVRAPARQALAASIALAPIHLVRWVRGRDEVLRPIGR